MNPAPFEAAKGEYEKKGGVDFDADSPHTQQFQCPLHDILRQVLLALPVWITISSQRFCQRVQILVTGCAFKAPR